GRVSGKWNRRRRTCGAHGARSRAHALEELLGEICGEVTAETDSGQHKDGHVSHTPFSLGFLRSDALTLTDPSEGPQPIYLGAAMIADSPWITLPTTRVGANRLSIHSRPRCSQTLGRPIAAAPPMSASGLSPTTHAPPSRMRTR